MSAYKSNSRKIKDALLSVLTSVTYDAGSGAEAAFVSVLDNTKDSFDGYPAVRVLPNSISSSTGSSSQRDHKVSYTVILHLPLEDPSNIESATYNQMYDLTDLVIDALENSDFENKLQVIDPNIPVFMMNVTQNQWRVASGKVGGMLFANITCEVSYFKQVS